MILQASIMAKRGGGGGAVFWNLGTTNGQATTHTLLCSVTVQIVAYEWALKATVSILDYIVSNGKMVSEW